MKKLINIQTINRINKHIIANLFYYGILIFILPFLFLSFFNHPASDDYYCAYEYLSKGFWGALKWNLNNLTGRYSQMSILFLNPLSFNSFFCFKIAPIFLLIFSFFSLYYLIKAISNNEIQNKTCLNLSLTIIILYLFQMSSTAEGFYWYTSSMYQLGCVLIIWLLYVLTKLNNTSKLRVKILLSILSILLIFVIIGLNEMFIPFLNSLFLIIIVINLFQKRMNIPLLLLLLFSILFSIISIKAPGNSIRQEWTPIEHSIFQSVFSSINFIKIKVLRWLINPAVILFTILYLPIGLNSNIKTSIFKINPFFSFIIFLGLLVSLIFPIYYAYGVGAPARAENVIYWFFLVGWFYNVQVFINFFKSKYAYSIKIPFNLIGLSILIVLFLSTESNIRIAYKDILSGTAFKYNWELLERYKLINESKNDTIEIDCIRNIPKTIFFRDLTYSDYLENGFSPFSKYFNKKMIRLRKEIIDMEKQKIFLKKELNKFEKKCCPEGGG